MGKYKYLLPIAIYFDIFLTFWTWRIDPDYKEYSMHLVLQQKMKNIIAISENSEVATYKRYVHRKDVWLSNDVGESSQSDLFYD